MAGKTPKRCRYCGHDIHPWERCDCGCADWAKKEQG